jgi:hypothetical protein
LNPFSAETRIVDVADIPRLIAGGLKADTEMVKLACAYLVTKASLNPALFGW